MFIRITWYLLADHTDSLGCFCWHVETFLTTQSNKNIYCTFMTINFRYPPFRQKFSVKSIPESYEISPHLPSHADKQKDPVIGG